MSQIGGISDGIAILISAVTQALDRCQGDGNSFYSRVGGVQGLAQLMAEDKIMRKNHSGIGRKTREIIEKTKRVILEAVAEDAEIKLRAKGQWKGPPD